MVFACNQRYSNWKFIVNVEQYLLRSRREFFRKKGYIVYLLFMHVGFGGEKKDERA